MIVLLLLTLPAVEARWDAILACPKVSSLGSTSGTGVVIGVKDGFAYLLTANHVAVADRAEVQFTSRGNYPKAAWFGDGATVIARWPDPDLALVRFPTKKRAMPILPLAPAWQRPKAFPVPVLTLGVGNGEATTALPDTLIAKEFVKRDGKDGAFFWRTQTAPEPGRSGGPLLDGRGRVIGITAARRDNSGYYTHHDEILAALKREGFGWLVPKR